MASNCTISNDGITLFKAQTALNRVKHRFETDGCALAIISEDRYADAVDIMRKHYVPDNAACRAFGVEWEENYEHLVLRNLRKNVSLMVLSPDGDHVMGIMRMQPISDAGEVFDLDRIQYEPLRDLLKFLAEQDKKADFFGRFGVSEAMQLTAVCTHRDYRRRGVARKMFGASVALAAELGFKAVEVAPVSSHTQKICMGEGFQVIHEVPYAQYVYKGESLRSKTGLETAMQVYGKAL